jgi:glycosyltransferase 2 family protein
MVRFRRLLQSHRAVRLLSLALSIGVLLVIVSRISPDEFASFYVTDAGALAVAALFAPLVVLMKIGKWRLLLGALGQPVPWNRVITSWLGGMAVSLLTPARLGELARVAYLPAAVREQSVGVLGVDRLTDVIALGFFAVTAALLSAQQTGVALLSLSLALACVAGLIIFRAVADRLIVLASRLSHFGHLIENVLRGLACISLWRLLGALVLAATASGVGILQFALLLQSLRPPGGLNSILISAATFPLIVLSNLIPLSINGLGVREGTAVWLMQAYSVSTVVAASSTLLSFALNTLAPGLCGSITMMLLASHEQG